MDLNEQIKDRALFHISGFSFSQVLYAAVTYFHTPFVFLSQRLICQFLCLFVVPSIFLIIFKIIVINMN